MNKNAPDWVVHAVNTWASEVMTPETAGILGYCGMSAEQAIFCDGGIPNYSPEIRMSRQSMTVDRAVRDMESGMRNAILIAHVVPGSVKANISSYKKHYRCGRSKFYQQLDGAYWFIAGFLRNTR